MATRTGIVLLLILLVGAQLAAVPEARQFVHLQAPAAGYFTSAVDDVVASGGARWPSKWNTRTSLVGDRVVPGGPDPQHHH
uniref:Uncharacterized protein n=1 Tax=Leersia perrieri TaxID=77586 RepID=A0A0D9WIM7_9ORYZ